MSEVFNNDFTSESNQQPSNSYPYSFEQPAAAQPQPSAPVPPVIPVHTPETQPAQPAAPVVTEPAPEEAPETTEPAPEAPEAPQAPAAETNANTCPHCGAAVTAEGARFCTACGGRLDG